MLMKLVNNITLWWGLLTGNIIPTNNIWNILLTGGEKLCLELCGFSHSYFIIYQSPGFLHTQTPASQTLLHQCSAQRIRKQKCNLMDNSGLHWFPILVSAGLWSHLFILLVCEVVGDFVPQPHHVLDGRLPDSPGSLAVGVKAAVRDLTSSPPPAPEAAPFVPIELRALEENSGAVVEHEHPAPPGVVRLPGVLQTDGAPVGAVDRSVAAAVRHLAPLQDGRAAPPGPEAAVPGVVEGGLLHLQLRPLVHHDTPGLQARGGDIAPSDRPPPALAVERGWDSGSEVWGVRWPLFHSIREYDLTWLGRGPGQWRRSSTPGHSQRSRTSDSSPGGDISRCWSSVRWGWWGSSVSPHTLISGVAGLYNYLPTCEMYGVTTEDFLSYFRVPVNINQTIEQA